MCGSGHRQGGARVQGRACARCRPPLRGPASIPGHATAAAGCPGTRGWQTGGKPREGACAPPPCAGGPTSVQSHTRQVVAGSSPRRQACLTRRRVAPLRSSAAVTLRPAHGRSSPETTAGAVPAAAETGACGRLSHGPLARDSPCGHWLQPSIRQRSQVTKALGALHFAV